MIAQVISVSVPSVTEKTKPRTLSLWGGSVAGKPVIAVANDLRTLLFIAAFVSIGLEFRAKVLKTAGWRPVGVFAAATVFNLVAGLALSSLLFANFKLT